MVELIYTNAFDILVSKVVSRQRLDQMAEENVKLEGQVERQKALINDQLLKILKQVW